MGSYDILSSLNSQLSYAYFGIPWLPEEICRAVTVLSLHAYPVPDPMNTFFSSRGRLLNNFGSLVNTDPSTSLEYALRPPASPRNSGFSLPKKEATLLSFTLSGFSK